MARNKDDEVEIVQEPDFDLMRSIFLNDIKPVEEKLAKERGDASTAWKAIEKDCHLNKKAAKWLYFLWSRSEEERDDILRTLYGGMSALNIGISEDLVDRMGADIAPGMPTVNGKGLGTEGMPALQ